MQSEQRERVASAPGFIAALDQSGGSTPAALAAFGIDASRFGSDEEMYDLMHAMRTRIMTSDSFTGQQVLGAILFEKTMDREVEGLSTADYLWSHKQVVPFLKVDKGLDEIEAGVQRMKPLPELPALLERAHARGIFGTKMRSVVHKAVVAGIATIVEQQFDVGIDILDAGLVPILEPEVSISCPDKAEAEELLLEQIVLQLGRLEGDQKIMLKLTLPDTADCYGELIADPRVLRVVALSGGYPRDQATAKLAKNPAMIASFSRALVEGLSEDQSPAEFDAALASSIGSIFEASIT